MSPPVPGVNGPGAGSCRRIQNTQTLRFVNDSFLPAGTQNVPPATKTLHTRQGHGSVPPRSLRSAHNPSASVKMPALSRCLWPRGWILPPNLKNPSAAVCDTVCCLCMLARAKLGAFRLSPPRVVRARYDRRRRRILIHFSTGLDIAFSPRDAQGLEDATPAQLAKIEISPSGFGIHFPAIDADLYLPALLMGLLGSRNWMAARLGALGGKSRSAAKVAAAKKNGRHGGRPRKTAEAAA